MNRSSEKNPAKLMYFLSIVIGALVLFSADSWDEQYTSYITIFGFALLMFGLYKSTTSWVSDNPHPKNDKAPYEFYEEEDPLKKEE
ncbi:hypothetical protein [Ascidiimonas sp. W6]|uniref:hypothetical protein n=1 Tax=Ascidiimonas meishanensis TaxID=3128903 RepID=UPI0030EE8CF1